MLTFSCLRVLLQTLHLALHHEWVINVWVCCIDRKTGARHVSLLLCLLPTLSLSAHYSIMGVELWNRNCSVFHGMHTLTRLCKHHLTRTGCVPLHLFNHWTSYLTIKYILLIQSSQCAQSCTLIPHLYNILFIFSTLRLTWMSTLYVWNWDWYISY